MRDLAVLKAALADLLSDKNLVCQKDEQGKIVKTFCNLGAMRAARAMGCDELDNMVADAQYWVMAANASNRWAKVAGMTASAHANAGGLSFAAMDSQGLKQAHGHIACLSPEPMQFSGSLNKLVPMVCNIGQVNADQKVSKSFPVAQGEPDYFIWD